MGVITGEGGQNPSSPDKIPPLQTKPPQDLLESPYLSPDIWTFVQMSYQSLGLFLHLDTPGCDSSHSSRE